ncbi:MAG: beta-phosphoglucomutase [Clostridiales bacterium]|nr:beta-phosphoglucomutase [Clostridiales bacterium]
MYNRIFAIDPWTLKTDTLDRKNMLLMESLTSIGNGYMGMRGNFEEGYTGQHHQGTYIAGVWFPDKTRVGWWKNGYPPYFGKVINAVNFAAIGVTVNGEQIDLGNIEPKDFSVELDMRNGLLTRRYTAHVPGGCVQLTFRRFFSIVERRLAHFQVQVKVLSGVAEVEISSALDGDVCNKDSNYEETFWDVTSRNADAGFLQMRTKDNPFGTPRFTVSAAMQNRVSVPADSKSGEMDQSVWEQLSFSLQAGETATVEKTVAVITDRDTAPDEHERVALTLLQTAKKKSFDEHLAAQRLAWRERWSKADVTIRGDDEAQQGIRFNMFQLFATYYGEDERLNIGPKGFTGEKYGGATYWDTEAYILPMYLSVAEPAVNEKLLKYRHNQLDGAKHNARQQGLPGALYPMVTFTGVECHNEWEITFEEIHRNGAMAYAIYNYTNYTGDERYLREYGIDVLVELSRFWAGRVHYAQSKGLYMLHGVTGPNEYENNVNNNWYTNYLCQWTLGYTLESLKKVSADKIAKLDVTADETEKWQEIRHKMYLPEDKERGIFVQNDTFLDKDLQTVDAIPAGERPINQHWSWDKILRSCYIKQADVLQGMYFFGDHFTKEQKVRNFDFYEPMTVHESSLSASIHAIIAAEIGRQDKAMALYLRTARLDLDNYNNDTEDGLHITSMSGSWLAIVQGFAGMRSAGGKLSFAPFCPENWEGYSFTILYRGRRLQVEVEPKQVNIALLSGEALALEVCGQMYTVRGEMLCVPLKKKAPVKGILLDLDGVITETAEYHYQAWKELASEIGITIDRQFNECLKGVSRMDSLELILRHGGVADQYSAEEKTALAERKNRRYVELLKNLTPDNVLPGIRNFLQEARADGMKLGLASASKNARAIMDALNLTQSMDFIADAAAARSKPAPDIFLLAAEGVGLQPENCIGIEDASAGIKAIHAAGMRAVAIGASLHEADLLLPNTGRLVYGDVKRFFAE